MNTALLPCIKKNLNVGRRESIAYKKLSLGIVTSNNLRMHGVFEKS